MSSPETSSFVSLQEVVDRVVIGTPDRYWPIEFLQKVELYSDLVDHLQIQGSATTFNSKSMGECATTYQTLGIHNRKVRLPASKRRLAQRVSPYLDTNIHASLLTGLYDLNQSGKDDATAWYGPLFAMSYPNVDIICTANNSSVSATTKLMFERMAQFMLDNGDYGSTLSIVDTGRLRYIHYHRPTDIYTGHFNLLVMPPTPQTPDLWNTSRTSRRHQVIDLIDQDGTLGFYTNPRFYKESGALTHQHDTLGAYLVDTAKEIRLATLNYPHRINIPSFRDQVPKDTTISHEQAGLILGNLTLAWLHNPSTALDLISLLDLGKYFSRQDVDSAQLQTSLARADRQDFIRPDDPIYPNVPRHQLTDLARPFRHFMTMPLKDYLSSIPPVGSRLRVDQVRYYFNQSDDQ